LEKSIFHKVIPTYIVFPIAFFHFACWVASMLLLISFPFRYHSFDIDSYLVQHPNNKFLLEYPYRKDFPHSRDFKSILAFQEKTEENKCTLSFKKRWLHFLMGKQEENTRYDNCGNHINWQDMLLDSFKKLEQGNDDEKAVFLVKTAVLSCMLSHGYVRTGDRSEHLGNTKEISDKMAISWANTCARQYENYLFALSDNHRKLKHKLLNSGAYDMMFPKRVKDMFQERNSARCSSCCVSHGERIPPIKCGIQQETLNNSIELAIPEYMAYFDTIEDIIETIKDEKEKNRRIDVMINFLNSYMDFFDDEIDRKWKESPDMLEINHIKHRPNVLYMLAYLHYLKGDKRKTKKLLIDTIKYSKGLELSPQLKFENIMYIYSNI